MSRLLGTALGSGLIQVGPTNASYQPNPLINNTWLPALQAAGSGRASIGVIGDSVTDGFSATNFDSTDYVSLLRAALQSDYGDGGEGFVSAIHAEPTGESGWENPPSNRWSFTTGRWSLPSFDTKEGWGAIAGAVYWNSTTLEPTITGTFDTIQVMTGIKFDGNATKAKLQTYIDGGLAGEVEMHDGLNDHSQFAPGTILEYTATLGAHTVKLDTSAGQYVFVEGVRFLKGTTGVVVDRFGKAGMRASWLGVANDSDYTNYNTFYKSLNSTVDVLDEDLYVVMLGINDFVNSVAVATFQTALGVIAARCKAKGDTILVVPPKPSSGTNAAYQGYADAIAAVASDNGCLCLDLFERWGSTYNAGMMANSVHPNNTGHADIKTMIYEAIKLP